MPISKGFPHLRLGLLGGSFNPPHVGHLRMAIEAREALALDRVDLVPAAMQPLKHGGEMLPFADRVRLLELALDRVPGLGLNLVESERPGPSYTADTLAVLRERNPGAELFYILGAENLQKLPLWRQGLDLPHLANLVVLGREDLGLAQVARDITHYWPKAVPHPATDQAGQSSWTLAPNATIHFLPLRRLDVSSTDIRERWRKSQSLKFLVPSAVEEELVKGWPGLDEAWGSTGNPAQP